MPNAAKMEIVKSATVTKLIVPALLETLPLTLARHPELAPPASE